MPKRSLFMLRKLLFVLPSLLFMLSPAAASAKQGNENNHAGGVKVDVKINQGNHDSNTSLENENTHGLGLGNVEVVTSSAKVRFVETDNLFDIRGTINSVGTGEFSVNGQTIVVDPSKTGHYNQKGD